uniref:Trafficking protein particle complex subunit 8 n=1 Tax=Glossina palpalis gambiensis TaxID=67801 RepID=A0A1B0B6W0_9MUSC
MIHLTGHNYNAREIIQNIFSPLVGVITSFHADEVCHRNNLSFVELLQPFARLQNDAQFRDVLATSVSIRGLRLNFCDVDWRPPQTVLARKMLNESVTNAHSSKTKVLNINGVNLELPDGVPWFEHWRETFLAVQFPADHEFTRHLLSCLIVLSSGDPNVVETAQKLTQRVHQMQSVTPQKLPKWFQPNDVLNSYVILHEGSQGDLSRAQQSYELLKSTFIDSKCFLIQVNSLDGTITSEIPDYWTAFIKRQPKVNDNAVTGNTSTDQLSGNKTPQDISGVSSLAMPNMHMSVLGEPSTAHEANEVAILHPLSPVQEHATEAINSRFSISCESIASQNINPNVWSGDTEAEAHYGQCLNAMDVENLRHFVQDYAVRALIPYVEQLVATLNEAVTNKKGVSKSLLSATKRWFVTSKPGASASNQNAVIYTHESAELQTRRLGDLYFMFCHYNMAFQAYHQAKRDFNADSAWQYYAGALEMAALSAFMLGTANRKTYDYMEDAIACYLNVCKLQQFATRATLLSIECLKTARLYGEAAKQLIRMTSEESDLRSALLLEQAAYCFLVSTPVMHRKYAFQIVLSGNRYSRAGQRKHAYRCYNQAYQVFQQRGWSLAEDHIQFTMAKQAYMLKKLDEASCSFAHLLRPGSLQGAQQQLSFLKEYIQTQNEYTKRHPEMGLLTLALPQVLQDSIRVLTLAPPAPTTNHVPASNIDINSDLKDEFIWHKIEEMLVAATAKNRPLIFKPLRSLFCKENPTTDNPIAVQGEPLIISVTIINTIRCGLVLNNVDLLWSLKLDNGDELSNMCLYEGGFDNSNKSAVKAAIKTFTSQSLTLEERAQEILHFKLTPKLTGLLMVVGIVAQISSIVEPNIALKGSLIFEKHTFRSAGKQAQNSLNDQKLNIRIIPPVPVLSVCFSSVPADLIVGEIIPITITLRNEGAKPVEDIYLSCDNPRWLTLQDKETHIPLSILNSIKNLSNEQLVKDKEIRRQHVCRLLKPKSSEHLTLEAQETVSITAWLQAPYDKGEFTLRLMFYYALPANPASVLKYRLIRHHWQFQIHECLCSEVSCVVSNCQTGELGLNINVRNNNKTPPQHPLLSELYINSLALLSEQFQLNKEKFYVTNQMEISAGLLGDRSLKSSKSASFQCRLQPSPHEKNKAISSFQNLLAERLSYREVMPANAVPNEYPTMPQLSAVYSFLTNHETTYFNFNITTEEFNKILANYEPHSTLAVCWAAAVVQNGLQRLAQGQHFVQLKYLYEKNSCPLTDSKQFSLLDKDNLSEKKIAIDEFANKKFLEINDLCRELFEKSEIQTDFNEDTEDHWEVNDNYIGQRCLLEDDTFLLSAKA